MTFDAPAALSVCARIADHLCDTAFRHGDRCAWMGVTQDAEDDSDQVDFTYGTVGPDLYGGSSGVALFLSEACRRTGDRRWGDTALAGIAQALDQLDTIPPAAQAGFYTGHVGVAYAAALIGRSLERADLEAQAVAVLDRVSVAADGDLVVDLVSGGTGAIAPLLALADRLDRPALRDLAMRLGRRTVAAAIRSDDGWSWPVSAGAIEAVRPLTGLAHGAAGIGWSLLELGSAAGAGEMIEAAQQAFRYEDRWFRPAEDNWPDFREEEGDDAPACVAWCHGAPGIGLDPASRGRARIRRLPGRRGSGDANHPILPGRPRLLDRRRFLSLPWPRRAGRHPPLRVSRARSPRKRGARMGGGGCGCGTVCGCPGQLALRGEARQQPVADDRAGRHRVLLSWSGGPCTGVGAAGRATCPARLEPPSPESP